MRHTSTPDYPRTRASATCPFCRHPKGFGLVACWPCFRSSGAKNCEPRAERVLEAFECRLIERAERDHD